MVEGTSGIPPRPRLMAGSDQRNVTGGRASPCASASGVAMVSFTGLDKSNLTGDGALPDIRQLQFNRRCSPN